MAGSRAVARAKKSSQRRRREVVAFSEQQDSEGGAAVDADVSATIRQLVADGDVNGQHGPSP